MCEFLNCPICEAEASDLCPCGEVEPCTCYDGWIYMDDFGKILTKEQYDALPEDERLKDNCPICNEGQIFGKNVTFNYADVLRKLGSLKYYPVNGATQPQLTATQSCGSVLRSR